MTKNTKGGKGHKRRGRKFLKPSQRELIFKDRHQEYGKLVAAKGDCRFECLCTDGKTRIAHVPGSFRNRIWCRVDDYVLVSIRIGLSTEDCDICYKYNLNEVKQLEEKELIKNLADKDDRRNFPEEDDLLAPPECENDGEEKVTIDFNGIVENDDAYKEYIDLL
jgi:translation initiation factor 1A